jgi:serine/threonine protein kinase
VSISSSTHGSFAVADDVTGPIEPPKRKRISAAPAVVEFDVVADPTSDLEAEAREQHATSVLKPESGDPVAKTLNLSTLEQVDLGSTIVRAILPGPGTILRDRYVLESRIGTGGTAFVYQARDLHREQSSPGTHSRVALKLLNEQTRCDPAALERLKREFALLQSLAHPNIVRVFDFDVDQDTWFLTMELLEGRTLSSTLRAAAKTNVEPLAALKQCAAALEFMHSRQTIHCDLKPGNIFITRNGHVRLLDFGAACVRAGEAEPLSVAHSATLAYASPQVLRHEPCEARDDVYGLACVAYEWLTGVHPFKRKNALEAEEDGLAVEERAGLTHSQWETLARAMSFERAKRPTSVREFIESLERQPSVATIVVPQMLATHTDTVRITRIATGVACLVVGVGALSYIVGKNVISHPAQQATNSESQKATSTSPSVASPASIATMPAVERTEKLSEPSAKPAAAATRPASRVASRAAPARAVAVVGFETNSIVVSASASAAVIPIVIDKEQGRAIKVTWRTRGESAQPGVDYTSVESGVARLNDRQTRQMIYVPLRHNASGAAERTFIVELQAVVGDAQLGKRTTTRVIIRNRV